VVFYLVLAMKFVQQKLWPTRDIEHFLASLMNDDGTVKPWSSIEEAQRGRDIGRVYDWRLKKQPFFNIYPVIVECLKNTNADIDIGMIEKNIIHELGVIEVRTCEGCEIPPFFMGFESNALFEDGHRGDAVFVFSVTEDGTYTFNIRSGRKPMLGNGADEEIPFLTKITKLAIGVLMLAGNPEFCTPVLLARDRHKAGTDEEAAALAKAKKRGVVGFSLGEHIQIGPHVRRPHFGIRWTGKGAEVPKYVPIKGCMVHRNKLLEVPTGFDGH
jgi:hypothetical protein